LDGCGRGLVAYPGRAIPILVLDLLPFQISLVLEVVQQACRSKSSVGCCCYTNAVQIARFLCGSTKELLLSFPSCNAGSAWSSSNLEIIMMYENYSNQYCTLLSCNYLFKTNLPKTDMPPKNIRKVGIKWNRRVSVKCLGAAQFIPSLPEGVELYIIVGRAFLFSLNVANEHAWW
jgi:hypothetical protein